MLYKIPEERYFRIHHIRPRFKNDVENVLLFMATEISTINKMDKQEFKDILNKKIRLYPENYSKKNKTIDNWRTEISALFGLFQFNNDYYSPSKLANILAINQDLVEFFRYFLYYFQYPGGHLKPKEILRYINCGIKFHPTRYLLGLLIEGKKRSGDKGFGISAAEATYCVFNDLAVTRDQKPIPETLDIILNNRESGMKYVHDGDMIRYAKDILDYMELADLVRLKANYQYYPNMHNVEVLEAFLLNREYFSDYESFYKKDSLTLSDIKQTQSAWFNYVNSELSENLFSADVMSVLSEYDAQDEQSELTMLIIEKILDQQSKKEKVRTKEIGDVGEAIVIEHEKKRMIKLERDDLIHLIKKMPESLAVGYDIKSFLGKNDDFSHILIEVKTTISKGKLSHQSFHMTSNEWVAASSYKDLYFIYRIMISSSGIKLFVIRDPVSQYKKDLLSMVPNNGADIRYGDHSGHWEALLG